MIIVSTNRGLCGSYNTNLLRKIRGELSNPERLKINRTVTQRIESKIRDEELKVDFITIGKKGDAMIKKMGKNIIASFPELAFSPSAEDTRPLAKIVIEEYLGKKYDKVVIVYTDFVSAINQQTKIRQILPVSKVDIEKQIAEIDVHAREIGLKEPKIEYKIEPNPNYVLKRIFPRLIEMQLYHAIQESNASKESARMLAMRNATEAAEEMVNGFALAYNQIRQQKITQEIAEISAGKAALENV